MRHPLLLAAACTTSLAACATRPAGIASRPAVDLERLSAHLADLVERLRPALVQIRAVPDAAHEARPAAGFIVDPSGIVLTVAHAVTGGDHVEVELSDGRRRPGTVIGKDTGADLAAVKIEDDGGLPALVLGDSDGVRAGEFVLALGHPYGLRQAVSLGIVSDRAPPPDGGAPGVDYIYTDALVNPGCSGGPLVNLAGEVIGVEGWAARNGSMGIAVPVNLVKRILPRLLAAGLAGAAPGSGRK